MSSSLGVPGLSVFLDCVCPGVDMFSDCVCPGVDMFLDCVCPGVDMFSGCVYPLLRPGSVGIPGGFSQADTLAST